MNAATELRPLSIGEVLDVAIKIFWQNAWTLVRVVVLIVAPVQVVAALVQASALPDDVATTWFSPNPTDEPAAVDPDELWVTAAAFGITAILGFVASTLATGACFKGVADAYLGERPNWRTSLAFAARRVHSLLWLTVLFYFLVILGFVACVLPGIWIGIAWSVAVPVLLTEGVRGRRALGRSFRLVRGRWWPTFALVVLALLIAGFVSTVVTMLLTALLFTDAGENPTATLVLNSIGGVLSAVATTPLTAAFLTVLYFDLRVRKEGFDLALLAERIGVPPDPERTGLAPRSIAAPPAPPAPAPAGSPPSGANPPYWPPPPGWPPPEEPPNPANPPYWPPPPGWRPPEEPGKE